MKTTDTQFADVLDAPAPEAKGGPKPPVKSVLIGKSIPDLIRDELLSEIFASTVLHRANHMAMTTIERRFTYAEVDAQATAIARALVAPGVRPGDAAGLWMARGPELLIGQIAIA